MTLLRSTSLRWRVPNPPPTFVGRDRELAALDEALRRGPVALLSGPGGIGKSALVRRWVRAAPDGPLLKAIAVELRPEDPLDQAIADLHDALTPRDVVGEPWERVLLAAEATSAVLIVEDLHYADERELADWLEALAAYAVSSRWILTARRFPVVPTLAEQTIALDVLSADDAADLARRLRPGLTDADIAALVTHAAGNPFELRQAVTRSDARQDLRDASAALVAALARLPLGLSRPDLERLAGQLRPEALLAIAEAGSLVESGDRLRLHDRVRERLAPELAPDQGPALLDGLLSSADPAATLEAARALVDSGRVDEAATHLEGAAGALATGGMGLRAWRLVRTSPSPRLRGAAFLLAAGLDAEDPLRWAARQPRPVGSSLEIQVAWLGARLRVVGVARCIDEAAALEQDARAADAPALAFEAGLAAGRGLVYAGRLDEAEVQLQGLVPTTEPARARREVALARLAWLRGRSGEATDRVRRVADLLDTLEGRERTEAMLDAHLVRLDVRVDAAASDASSGPPAGGLLPEILMALRNTLAGRTSEVAAFLARQSIDEHDRAGERVSMRLISVVQTLVDGPAAESAGHVDAAWRDASESRMWNLVQWTALAAGASAWFLGRPEPELAWPADVPPPSGPPGRLIEAVRFLHAFDRGERPAWEPALVGARELRDPLALFGRAACLAGAGRPREAALASAQAANQAASNGARIIEHAARSLQVMLLLADRRDDEARQALVPLVELTRAIEGVMLQNLTELVVMATTPYPDVLALERIIAAHDLAPLPARLAHALLSREPPSSALDRLLLTGLRRGWSGIGSLRRQPPGAPGRRGWGVDLLQRRAWLVDRQTVDLSRSTLALRLLELLARADGEVTKEALAVAAWELPDYNPMRDDKRLQVAIGRLRKQLEGDPGAPRRILTTDAGYALGDFEPFTLLW